MDFTISLNISVKITVPLFVRSLFLEAKSRIRLYFLSISVSLFAPDVTMTFCSICISGFAEEEIAKGTGITIMPLTNLCMWGSFPSAEPGIRSDGCLPGAQSIMRRTSATFTRNSLIL